MICFEFPASERVRFWLRLEQLYERLFSLILGSDPAIHHAALQAFFELLDVISRMDTKTDLLKKLSQQKSALQSCANCDLQKLTKMLRSIDEITQLLFQLTKYGWQIRQNEWLMLLKQRFNISGGMCQCDLPSYFVWQTKSAAQRQQDLNGWIEPLRPIYQAVHLLLGILREFSEQRDCVAQSGSFQLMLSDQRTQLFRVCLTKNLRIMPEFFASKYMFSIHFMQMSTDQIRTKSIEQDIAFVLSSCAL